jgi:hypothetical protein
MNIKRIAVGIAAVVVSAGLLTGCDVGSNNKRDLNGISSMDPDYAEIYNATDGHPNVGLICIRGVGFATTTRDYSALTRVKEWDKFCAQFSAHSVVTSQERKNG